MVKLFIDEAIDIQYIAETFEASFQRKFDKPYWNWRFSNNPISDKPYISYIFEDDTLSSYYAVSPIIVDIKGKAEKFALSNMTMTHPNYQGKGYFTQIARVLYSKLKDEGYMGVIGFANSNSHYGFRKYLNWQDLSIVNMFKVSPSSFKTNLFKSLTSLTYEIKDIDLDVITSASTMHFSSSMITPNRNFNILKWRVYECPSQKYKVLSSYNDGELIAHTFIKFYKDSIDIMENFSVFADHENRNEQLSKSMAFLIKYFDKGLNLWSNLHSSEHVLLEKLGFVESEFNSYFGVIPFVKNPEILDIRNWHYRFIDSDIF